MFCLVIFTPLKLFALGMFWNSDNLTICYDWPSHCERYHLIRSVWHPFIVMSFVCHQNINEISSLSSSLVQNNTICIAMFQNFLRHAQAPALGILRFPNRRAFSYVSTHQTFPASLHRFQIHRDSKLYDRAFGQDDWEYEDGIEVSADGLVHPDITADCICANATWCSSLANVLSF